MATAGSLRSSLAFVEIGIDENFLRAELAKAQAQVGKMAENIRGATAGTSTDMKAALGLGDFESGFLQMFTRVRALRIALEGITVVAAAFHGQWDQMFKAGLSLPLVRETINAALAIRGDPSMERWAEMGIEEKQQKVATEKSAMQLMDILNNTRFERATSGLRDVALEIAKINEEAKKKTLEVWMIPFGSKESKTGIAAEIDKTRLVKIAVAETKAAYEKMWKEISEGSDRDVAAYFETVADIAKEGVEEDKEYLEQRWRNMEDSGDRLASEYDQQVSDLQAFHKELSDLAESVMTPEEKLVATEEDLRVRLGLGAGDELYRRVMKQALSDAAAAMPDVLRTEIRQMTGGFGAQFMGVGSQGDPKLAEQKKTNDLLKEIARKVGIDPGILVN